MPKNDTGVIQKMADTVTSVLEWIVHNYIYHSPSKMCVLRLFPYYYSVKSEARDAPHSLIMVAQAHWPYGSTQVSLVGMGKTCYWSCVFNIWYAKSAKHNHAGFLVIRDFKTGNWFLSNHIVWMHIANIKQQRHLWSSHYKTQRWL